MYRTLHHRTTLCVVTIDFLVHMHLDSREISQFFIEFNSNLSGFAVYSAGISTLLVSSGNLLEILFLGQEFGHIFDCKCWEYIQE